jgi:hypothetical protein
MTHHKTSTAGFALLMTLMVVSVIVSITAAVIELSLKQLQLAVTTRDSEIAFQAANAGMECARYARRISADEIETGNGSLYPFPCFGVSDQILQSSNLTGLVSNEDTITNTRVIKYYTSNFTWSTNDRCSKLVMLAMNVSPDADASLVIDNLHDLFPGYPEGMTKTCEVGSYCTVAQVTGYSDSAACNAGYTPTIDTVRREILLEF